MEITENLGTTAAPAAESAGRSEIVDAQSENLNAAETAGAGQPEVADGRTAAGSENVAAAAEAQKPKQGREENAAFKQMRQRIDALESENRKYKSMADVVGTDLGVRSSDPETLRIELQARREGVTPDVVRAREITERQRYREQLNSDPEFIAAQTQLRYYRQELARRQREQDVAELQAKYPADKIDADSLGEQYAKLRAAGVDNLTAYAAVRTVSEMAAAQQPAPPPDTGAVGTAAEQEKDFYTPEEVDRLTSKQLDDPKIMEKVMKSMTKWK